MLRFDAGGETKITESVMFAKIATSDFYHLAACEK